MSAISQTAAWVRLGMGALEHAVSGKTPPEAYQALIRLFCVTGGRSSDSLSRWVARARPPLSLGGAGGVLGLLSPAELGAVTDDLQTRGYHVFKQRLPEDVCERLLDFGLDQPSVVRPDESEVATAQGTNRAYRGDRSAPKGIRYDVPVQDLLANNDVQDLLADTSILAVAQAYLGSRPMADVLSMWWHTALSDKPSAAAAQYYHFDMDRIKWLKFFIYLTDVGTDNGPHSFVAGSHRTDGIPRALLSKGYARLTDEEVLQHYRPEDIIEFTGPRGTILAEDTRGLHKGKHVGAGDRLILQLQFSNSLFGGSYPKASFPAATTTNLAQALNRHPEVYKNFM